MNSKKGMFMKTGMLSAGVMLAMLAFGPYAAASPVRINFSGSAGSGYADLTLAPDPDASTNYQPTFSQSDADNGISPHFRFTILRVPHISPVPAALLPLRTIPVPRSSG